MKIVQALEDSNILLKRVTKTIETKEQKEGFLYVTWFCRCNFIRKSLNRKMGVAKRQGRGIERAGYGANRAGYGLKKKIRFHFIL